MYIFPGVGLGAILSKAVSVTQNMIYASGEALASSLTPDETAQNWMYPAVERIRDVSVVVTRGIIRQAQRDGVDRELALRNIDDEQLDDYIRSRMYDPFTEYEKVQEEIQEIASLALSSPTMGANGVASGAQKRGRLSTGGAGQREIVGKDR